MRIVRHTDKGYQTKLRPLDRRSAPEPQVQQTVSGIFAAIAKEGDTALLHFSEKFGGPKLTPKKLRVSDAEIESAVATLPAKTRKAILAARANVQAFAKASLRESWFMKNKQGVIV
ncbi:MAG TPA: histidinol dehydrogenase, partial [Chthoniobacterales bacterium]|nr:histidinol dehydrogenase [Chthoniobacterales bacterium]